MCLPKIVYSFFVVFFLLLQFVMCSGTQHVPGATVTEADMRKQLWAVYGRGSVYRVSRHRSSYYRDL